MHLILHPGKKLGARGSWAQVAQVIAAEGGRPSCMITAAVVDTRPNHSVTRVILEGTVGTLRSKQVTAGDVCA